MRRPPRRRPVGPIVGVLGRMVGIVGLFWVGAAVATGQPIGVPPADSGWVAPLVGAVSWAVVTLVIAGGLVAVVPGYTDRTTDRIRRNPVGTFLIGFLVVLALLVVLVVLVVSIVGILLVPFLLPLILVVAVVGNLGFLASGRVVADGWVPVLAVAVLLGAVSGGIPVLGNLLGLVLSCMGVGAAYAEYTDDGTGPRTTADERAAVARRGRPAAGSRGPDPADRRPDGRPGRARSDLGDDPGSPRE